MTDPALRLVGFDKGHLEAPGGLPEADKHGSGTISLLRRIAQRRNANSGDADELVVSQSHAVALITRGHTRRPTTCGSVNTTGSNGVPSFANACSR